MATAQQIARAEKLVWILAYSGLLSLVLGIATLAYDATTGWVLIVLGACVAIAGGVMVWVRSRMRED